MFWEASCRLSRTSRIEAGNRREASGGKHLAKENPIFAVTKVMASRQVFGAWTAMVA
jgi:hypothetical protein